MYYRLSSNFYELLKSLVILCFVLFCSFPSPIVLGIGQVSGKKVNLLISTCGAVFSVFVYDCGLQMYSSHHGTFGEVTWNNTCYVILECRNSVSVGKTSTDFNFLNGI